jgi:hypothetical protein
MTQQMSLLPLFALLAVPTPKIRHEAQQACMIKITQKSPASPAMAK